MPDSNPLVSIIIPTYNYAGYITEAIGSILQQHYPADKIEIIVVDDGSADDTRFVLKDLIRAKTVRYFYQNNEGKASATAKAVKEANGKYIFNLDADDYFINDKIAATVQVFEEDESIVHVSSPAEIFYEKENVIKGAERIPLSLLATKKNGLEVLRYFYENNIFYGSGSTFAARTSALKKIDIPAAVDMYIDEFLVLSILPFGKSYFIERPLSVWRRHTGNYSVKINDVQKQKEKDQRLLKSSEAILDYLRKNNYGEKILNIYRLKNINRLIAYKETSKTKSIKDILEYSREVFFDIKPNWKIIKKYQVLHRLLPLSFYHFLKKIKSDVLYVESKN